MVSLKWHCCCHFLWLILLLPATYSRAWDKFRCRHSTAVLLLSQYSAALPPFPFIGFLFRSVALLSPPSFSSFYSMLVLSLFEVLVFCIDFSVIRIFKLIIIIIIHCIVSLAVWLSFIIYLSGYIVFFLSTMLLHTFVKDVRVANIDNIDCASII